MQQQIIPLFPLSIVVFPGHLVPLHIFEERYKKMIADCAGEEGRYEPFGISYENDGDVAAIGCAVTVTRRAEANAEGSFHIVCRARRRYRILQVYKDDAYLRGHVEFFDDDEDDEADPEEDEDSADDDEVDSVPAKTKGTKAAEEKDFEEVGADDDEDDD